MEREVQRLYARLPELLLPWYRINARDLPWRRDRVPYHVWLSEVMLQQTRAAVVCGYYLRFLAAAPDVEALATLEEARLLKLWEGLGYYNRARNLQKAAKDIVENRGGVFPHTYGEILSLPGVGPYIAGAIASICFELPKAAVDGNVLRIAARITEDYSPIDLARTRAEIGARLETVYPAGNCGAFTQALMELGATVCTPRSPDCGGCPVRDICLARINGTVSALPVRRGKKEKKVQVKTVFLLQCGDMFALVKRADGGLLSGLWQLPNVDGSLSAPEAIAAVEALGVVPTALCRELHRVHVFTHVKWQMVCYHLQCNRKAPGLVWADMEQIRSEYALPTAFRMFLEAD
jgi:A/G-specific adenine glycosylase